MVDLVTQFWNVESRTISLCSLSTDTEAEIQLVLHLKYHFFSVDFQVSTPRLNSPLFDSPNPKLQQSIFYYTKKKSYYTLFYKNVFICSILKINTSSSSLNKRTISESFSWYITKSIIFL